MRIRTIFLAIALIAVSAALANAGTVYLPGIYKSSFTNPICEFAGLTSTCDYTFRSWQKWTNVTTDASVGDNYFSTFKSVETNLYRDVVNHSTTDFGDGTVFNSSVTRATWNIETVSSYTTTWLDNDYLWTMVGRTTDLIKKLISGNQAELWDYRDPNNYTVSGAWSTLIWGTEKLWGSWSLYRDGLLYDTQSFTYSQPLKPEIYADTYHVTYNPNGLAPVPEPTTWTAAILGIAALTYTKRRRTTVS